ncbi:CDP-alcohol phosphatidyltransferase family protein [Pelagibius sp. Alg239-R121]|uniref:CDP-alcohol phosphatidyltransferase family protein n=1 Tax=Pelagibius sp. Alg239-R121 TaxID=2993448 RepID=UPI0024A788AD|nr:CDP-alcohol phosphatidyltransferase family protein [Pelagibius sp. Alg239-R121]
MSWLPNIITIARLLLVPVIIGFILLTEYLAAFWVFALAGVSDALDGYLANKLKAVSELGGYLDPIADKILLVGLCLTLGFLGEIPGWLVSFVVLRDVLIVSGAMVVLMITGSLKMEPLAVSKINTLAQIVLVGLVLASQGFSFDGALDMACEVAVYVVAATTFISGSAYVFLWGRRLVVLQRRA